MRNPLNEDSRALREFYERRERFWKRIDPNEMKVVDLFERAVADVVVAVEKSVSLDDCQFLHSRLAQYMNTLGEFVAKAEVEYLQVKDFMEDKFADDFIPTKIELESKQTKVLKSEIESTIQRKYREERNLMRLLYERWRIYRAKLGTGESMIEAIQNKVIQLRREWERQYQQEALSNGIRKP